MATPTRYVVKLLWAGRRSSGSEFLWHACPVAGREKEVVTLGDFFVDADSVGGGKKNEGHQRSEKLQLLRLRGAPWPAPGNSDDRTVDLICFTQNFVWFYKIVW